VNEAQRSDGNKAYYAKNDVWIDFNSRVIQPQYYASVLRKTGLTPNQAENTCWLLDKNVGGNAFNAIGSSGSEVQMGAAVNKDWARNSYARWDATTGECLVRVAAYNKSELITNEWLFGRLGDKQPAETWVKTGDSFSCRQNTFGFNLMNYTSTAAAAGIGGGAIFGAGIGAIAADANVKDTGLNTANCGNHDFRDLLSRTCMAVEGEGGECGAASREDCESLICRIKSGGSTKSCDDATTDEDAKAVYLRKFQAKLVEENGMGAGMGALVGAGVGAGAGAVATAITAFVEHNNISCRIGNSLDVVGFGKSGRVKSLKDYYIEWALRLPDTVMPQQTVTECNSWHTACNSINTIADCAMAVINYKPQGAQRSTQVDTACTVSGSTCVANNPVAVSHGACL
jgi:hypothetical protein